jgi:hypothetical protein
VFLPHAGIFGVQTIHFDPTWTGSIVGVGNAAVLHLGSPVTGVRPTPLYTDGRLPIGSSATVVGFGSTGGGTPGPGLGLKRKGQVSTESCGTFASDDTNLCWTFDAPVGAAGTDSGICFGDTGGPLLVGDDETAVVAGINAKFSFNNNCLTGTQTAATDVFARREWLQAIGGDDIEQTSCGSTAHVSDPGSSTAGLESFLDSTTVEELWTVAVPAGAASFRAAINIPAVDANFDLYVRRGSAPAISPITADCVSITEGNAPEYCGIAQPQAGIYYVLVRRAAGAPPLTS